MLRVEHAQRGAHLLGGGRIGRAEGRVRQQRHPRLDTEALHLLGGQQRHLDHLLGVGS